jgi:hypothetical protein
MFLYAEDPYSTDCEELFLLISFYQRIYLKAGECNLIIAERNELLLRLVVSAGFVDDIISQVYIIILIEGIYDDFLFFRSYSFLDN